MPHSILSEDQELESIIADDASPADSSRRQLPTQNRLLAVAAIESYIRRFVDTRLRDHPG